MEAKLSEQRLQMEAKLYEQRLQMDSMSSQYADLKEEMAALQTWSPPAGTDTGSREIDYADSGAMSEEIAPPSGNGARLYSQYEADQYSRPPTEGPIPPSLRHGAGTTIRELSTPGQGNPPPT